MYVREASQFLLFLTGNKVITKLNTMINDVLTCCVCGISWQRGHGRGQQTWLYPCRPPHQIYLTPSARHSRPGRQGQTWWRWGSPAAFPRPFAVEHMKNEKWTAGKLFFFRLLLLPSSTCLKQTPCFFLSCYCHQFFQTYLVSKYTWCLTSTETIRLIRDGALTWKPLVLI